MLESNTRHNKLTQKIADDYALYKGEFCAVYVGRLKPGIMPKGYGIPSHKGATLVYTPRRQDSILMLESYPMLIFIQGDHIFSLDEEICADLIRMTTSRNRFPKGKKLFSECQKYAAMKRPCGTPRLCRDIVKASMYKGKKSSRAMHMVLEYLEIAERMRKRIRVLPYPVDSPENGGVEFYLHLY